MLRFVSNIYLFSSSKQMLELCLELFFFQFLKASVRILLQIYIFFSVSEGKCPNFASNLYIFSVSEGKCPNFASNLYIFFQFLKASVRILPQIYIFFQFLKVSVRILPQIYIFFSVSEGKCPNFASDLYFFFSSSRKT